MLLNSAKTSNYAVKVSNLFILKIMFTKRKIYLFADTFRYVCVFEPICWYYKLPRWNAFGMKALFSLLIAFKNELCIYIFFFLSFKLWKKNSSYFESIVVICWVTQVEVWRLFVGKKLRREERVSRWRYERRENNEDTHILT